MSKIYFHRRSENKIYYHGTELTTSKTHWILMAFNDKNNFLLKIIYGWLTTIQGFVFPVLSIFQNEELRQPQYRHFLLLLFLL